MITFFSSRLLQAGAELSVERVLEIIKQGVIALPKDRLKVRWLKKCPLDTAMSLDVNVSVWAGPIQNHAAYPVHRLEGLLRTVTKVSDSFSKEDSKRSINTFIPLHILQATMACTIIHILLIKGHLIFLTQWNKFGLKSIITSCWEGDDEDDHNSS